MGGKTYERSGDVVQDGLSDRMESVESSLRDLAYQRLQLSRRIDEIDKQVEMLEGAKAANTLTKKDVDTRNIILQAQKEAADKSAAEKPTTPQA